ncbi:MAG: hypothetical protein HY822_10270 [Acidobacteria bacterium]|nr:hypothetical protein [Acidobacteriota bacterium]
MEANARVNPPGWAVLERRLIEDMSRAAFEFTRKHVRSGGTLIWKTSGPASPDDPYESFYNYPLLYALGGDDELRDLSFRLWSALTRQLTYDFRVMRNEYAKQTDWFHHGEGNLYFYYLGLADPTDHELADRARRFAGLYMNEDPEALNYDPKLKIIRSPRNGSAGPYLGSAQAARPFRMARGMAVYGLPLEDVPGVSSEADLRNPANALRMGLALEERLYRGGDVPPNLAATSLAVNAFLLTGERKYADWVKEYAEAWVERTRLNGGITPDNVGLSGRVGEYFNGKWWGGLYGWRWPHGYHSVGQAIQIGAANAMLLAGGDARFLSMPRTNLEKIVGLGKKTEKSFVAPSQKDNSGWFAFTGVDHTYLSNLWYMSREASDWQLIEKVRAAEATDWRRVAGMHNKMDTGHDAPWLRFLAGDNPDYPERMLASALGQVALRLERMRDNWLLIDEYPGIWRKVDPDKTDFTKLNEHHWQGQNPVTTEALVQLMLGAPQILYNGGMLHATLRYFDPERRRPGVPPDVAALVRKLEPGGATLELVNLSPFHARKVIVQAGTFGEHQFTTVGSLAVNRKFFEVALAPGAGIVLDMGMRRFANQPTYAFPWHGDAIPVR